jgi:hypothetical protein
MFSVFRDTVDVEGEFTGVNGGVGTTTKFNGNFTLTYVGEGVYDLKAVQQDGSTALKGFYLKSFSLIAVAPAAADGGSGVTEITTDTLQSAGVVRFTTRNLAGTAADVIGRVLIRMAISPEATS